MQTRSRIVAALALLTAAAPVSADPVVVDARITKLPQHASIAAASMSSPTFDLTIDREHRYGCRGAAPSPRAQDVAIRVADATDILDQYRSFIATARVAHRLGRTVSLYLDGCVGGVPRVVGIEIV